MLSFSELFGIIEEAGGKWIFQDPRTGIYLFSSSDPNRQGEYFKLLDTNNTKDFNYIARIGIRNPQYEIHYKHLTGKNVFLKPTTIQNMVNALAQPHKPATNDRRLFAQLLQQKNDQINEFNRANHQAIPNIQNFNNWQAAIIYTNLNNGKDKGKLITNDTRMGDVDPAIIPFDQPIPDYIGGLPNSEEEIKRNVKVARCYGRY